MAKHDIFLCPTMTVPAVRADQDISDEGLNIDGEEVDPEFGYSTTHQFNMLGICPVVSVPSRLFLRWVCQRECKLSASRSTMQRS